MITYKPFMRILLLLLVSGTLIFSGCSSPTAEEQGEAPASTTAAPSATEESQPAATEESQPAAAEATEPAAGGAAASALTPDRLVPEIVLVFSTAEHDPFRNEAGILMTNEWEKLGLRVKPQPLDFEKQVNLYSTGEGFNAFTVGYDGRPERLDPDILLRRIYYTGLNFMGYSNPEVDALIDAQRAEMDIDKRREIVFKIQEIVANDLPAVSLYHDSFVGVYNNELWENVLVVPGQGTYNYWTLLEATPKTDMRNFRIAHNELPVNLNPFFETSGSDTEVMREIYDTLARVGLDGLPKPGAAESWEALDPTTIQVNLHQGMKFNDGVPVTAKDVKYSYDVQKEQGSSTYKPFLTTIESIDVVDDYTLIFHLVEPDAAIFMATFAQIYIIPEHIWSQIPDPKVDYDNNSSPVGSGPYNLALWRPNEELTATANKDYQYPVNPDSFTVIQYANPDAIFQALLDQQADTVFDSLNMVQMEIAKGAPYLTPVNEPTHQVRLLGFNVRMAPFNDPAFRDALGYTVDYDTIVNVILAGAGAPGSGVIAPANEFWHNPNQLLRRYDPAKARELLAAAGYEWDAQGLMYMPADQ